MVGEMIFQDGFMQEVFLNLRLELTVIMRILNWWRKESMEMLVL